VFSSTIPNPLIGFPAQSSAGNPQLQKYPARRRAVAAVLKEARVASGLSQRKLSAELHEVNNYAYMIESARQPARTEEFIAWALKCGADPVELMRRVMRSR
jgi:hypothetical protein